MSRKIITTVRPAAAVHRLVVGHMAAAVGFLHHFHFRRDPQSALRD